MLPPEIGNLSKLERLILSENDLTTLPSEIGNLSNLTEISLWGNDRLINRPQSISTYAQGLGTVSRNMPGPFYVEGTSVELTASPSAGWRFVRWQGTDISDEQAQQQTITVSANQSEQTYTAYFEMNEGAIGIYIPVAMQ